MAGKKKPGVPGGKKKPGKRAAKARQKRRAKAKKTREKVKAKKAKRKKVLKKTSGIPGESNIMKKIDEIQHSFLPDKVKNEKIGALQEQLYRPIYDESLYSRYKRLRKKTRVSDEALKLAKREQFAFEIFSSYGASKKTMDLLARARKIKRKDREMFLSWGQARKLAEGYTMFWPEGYLKRRGVPNALVYASKYMDWLKNLSDIEFGRTLSDPDFGELSFSSNLYYELERRDERFKDAERRQDEKELLGLMFSGLPKFLQEKDRHNAHRIMLGNENLRVFRQFDREDGLKKDEAIKFFIKEVRRWKKGSPMMRHIFRTKTVRDLQEEISLATEEQIELSIEPGMRVLEKRGEKWKPEYQALKEKIELLKKYSDYLIWLVADRARGLKLKIK